MIPRLQRLFGQLLGPGTVNQLLEVGVGTGPNLAFYSQFASSAVQQPGIQITGLDPNTSMQQYAELSAQEAGLQDSFTFVQGSAEQLPFDDASFDAAVLTLVSALYVAWSLYCPFVSCRHCPDRCMHGSVEELEGRSSAHDVQACALCWQRC
jgi:hypothetical protein